jgi:hypothetical protein
MRYSCAKFVKYDSRVGLAAALLVAEVSALTPNDAVQEQRHVWGTTQSRWSSGGFAANPGSAECSWQVGAGMSASVHPHQLAKSDRGCKLRRPA